MSAPPKPRHARTDGRYKDVDLLFQARRTTGESHRGSTLSPRRDTGGLQSLNDWARLIATEATPGLDWSDRDTWDAIEGLLTRSGDCSQSVFAARLFLGYVGEPSEGDVVPGTDLTWAEFKAGPARDFAGRRWETSIELRRLFLARRYGGNTVKHFQLYNPAFMQIAHGLLEELETEVRQMASGRGENTNALPEEPETPNEPDASESATTPRDAPLGGAGGVAGEDRSAPSARTLERKRWRYGSSIPKRVARSFSVLSGLGMAVAIVGIMIAALVASPMQRDVETEILATTLHTYTPPASASTLPVETSDISLRVACARSSRASAHVDARTCIRENLFGTTSGEVLDPCYVVPSVNDIVVACMEGQLDEAGKPQPSVVARVEDYVDAGWLPAPQGLADLQARERTEFPWLLVLDLEDKYGRSYVCRPPFGPDPAYAYEELECSSDGHFSSVLVTADEFISGDVSIRFHQFLSIASQFNRSGAVWTVRVRTTDSSEFAAVKVRDAWF